MSGLFSSIIGFFVQDQAVRRSTIGMQVPDAHPADAEEAVANLRYVQAEVRRAEDSITYSSEEHGDLPTCQAEWYLQYITVAIAVAEKANNSQCIALSEAALEVLPRINPYAECYYDCATSPSASKNMRALRDLASEHKRASITLGKAILDVDPDAASMDTRMTFREDYDSLLRTTLKV